MWLMEAETLYKKTGYWPNVSLFLSIDEQKAKQSEINMPMEYSIFFIGYLEIPNGRNICKCVNLSCFKLIACGVVKKKS